MNTGIVPPSLSLSALLANPAINQKRNDYSYRSGWNPTIELGQQFKLGASETRALIKAITQGPVAEQKALLAELHARTESTAPRGSVALTAIAARELNALAQKLGLDLEFKSGQKPPLHPVG